LRVAKIYVPFKKTTWLLIFYYKLNSPLQSCDEVEIIELAQVMIPVKNAGDAEVIAFLENRAGLGIF
jgi:hypothetical protein